MIKCGYLIEHICPERVTRHLTASQQQHIQIKVDKKKK